MILQVKDLTNSTDSNYLYFRDSISSFHSIFKSISFYLPFKLDKPVLLYFHFTFKNCHYVYKK